MSIINVRFEDADRAALEAEAKSKDITLSKLIRSKALSNGEVKVERQDFDWVAMAAEFDAILEAHKGMSTARVLRDAGGRLGYNVGMAGNKPKASA